MRRHPVSWGVSYIQPESYKCHYLGGVNSLPLSIANTAEGGIGDETSQCNETLIHSIARTLDQAPSIPRDHRKLHVVALRSSETLHGTPVAHACMYRSIVTCASVFTNPACLDHYSEVLTVIKVLIYLTSANC